MNKGNFIKVVRCIIYSCSFFKEINRDASFHFLEDCQYDLFY